MKLQVYRFSIGLLIIAIAVQSFGGMLLWSAYLFHQDFIATELCENTASPTKSCLGTCHLTKVIKKAEEQHGSQRPSLERLDMTLICEQLSLRCPDPLVYPLIATAAPHHRLLKEQAVYQQILKPPKI